MDWRKTIGELEVENHYETLDSIVQRGMKRYSESQENGRVYMADGMAVKRHADIPMAAMWGGHLLVEQIITCRWQIFASRHRCRIFTDKK